MTEGNMQSEASEELAEQGSGTVIMLTISESGQFTVSVDGADQAQPMQATSLDDALAKIKQVAVNVMSGSTGDDMAAEDSAYKREMAGGY